MERVAREIFILKLVRHKNIIQLHEIIETPKQLYLFMEFAPKGELFDHIVTTSKIILALLLFRLARTGCPSLKRAAFCSRSSRAWSTSTLSTWCTAT